MVKSKKMSKTSIAVIILALLLVLSMVLGLTGAWFTKSNVMDAPEQNTLVFGEIGSVVVEATEIEHLRYNETQSKFVAVEDGVVMPGDKVLAGGLTLTYAEDEEPTDTTVWYLVKDQAGTYYVKSGTVLLAIADRSAYATAAQTTGNCKITQDNPIEISGQVLSIQIGDVWYNLDGSYDGTGSASGANAANAKESWQIGEVSNSTSAQGVALSTLPAQVGSVVYNNAGTKYAVAVIQTTNLTDAANAFDGLKAAIDAVLASPVAP